MTDEQRTEIEGIVAETRAIMHPLVNDPDEVYFQDTLGNLWVYAGRREVDGTIIGLQVDANTTREFFEPKEIAFLNI